MIGEPVIRETLRQQLQEKLQPRSEADQKLQEEIMRLRKIIKNNNLLDDDLSGKS